jgi:hypothetical protein
MIIAGLLMGFVKFFVNLALSWHIVGSSFSNSLLSVLIACLEDTYMLIAGIDSFYTGIALALLIIS